MNLKNISTSRGMGAPKISSLTPLNFLRFCQELEKVNFMLGDRFVITEKIDGSNIHIILIGDEIYFESSYGGPKKLNQCSVVLQDAFLEISTIFETEFKEISKYFYPNGVKISGELLWTHDHRLTQKTFTPVFTQYTTDNLGFFGGIVLYSDPFKKVNVELEKLEQLSIQDKLFLEKILVNNKTGQTMKFKNVPDISTLFQDLDFSKIKNILSNDVFNKPRFLTGRDAAEIEILTQVRDDLSSQLLSILSKLKSEFGHDSTIAEGVILSFYDTQLNLCSKYGMFNSSFKENKKSLWNDFDDFNSIFKDFQRSMLFPFNSLKPFKEKITNFQLEMNFTNNFEYYLSKLEHQFLFIKTKDNVDYIDNQDVLINNEKSMNNKLNKLKSCLNGQDYFRLFVLREGA